MANCHKIAIEINVPNKKFYPLSTCCLNFLPRHKKKLLENFENNTFIPQNCHRIVP